MKCGKLNSMENKCFQNKKGIRLYFPMREASSYIYGKESEFYEYSNFGLRGCRLRCL